MQYLVLGGTGTVGSQVVQRLLTHGERVRVLTHSKDKAGKLPKGVDVKVGDLTLPSSLAGVFSDIDGLFLLNGVTQTETHEGLIAVNEAIRGKVKKIVYLSVQNADAGVHIPHFGSKVAVELAVKASRAPYTILRPNNFFQNDLWFKDAIVGYNVYPQPIGDVGLHRVDVRDIADVALKALTTSSLEGQTINVIGPKAINGTSTAEIYTSKLARKISYGGNDLDAWEKQALAMMPPWLAYDFKVMYRFFQEKGLLGTEVDLNKMQAILGRAPRSFETFVEETVKTWR